MREWADGRDGVSVAVAAHSVRAVPPDWLEAIAGYAATTGCRATSTPPSSRARCATAAPSTAPARSSCSPAPASSGPRTSVVHAIHVDERDVALLADSDTIVVTCPTTEGNLGDGVLPALAYRDAGVRLAIGSDSQVRVDPFEETRELETGARREGMTRRALLAHHGDLWAELARNGLASLGLEGGDTIDVDLEHPDLRGVAQDEVAPALATCASAAVVCRQASRARAGGGSLS